MLKSLATGSLPETIAEDNFMNGAAEIPAFLQSNAAALGLTDPEDALLIAQASDALTAYPTAYADYQTQLADTNDAKDAADAAKSVLQFAQRTLTGRKIEALDKREIVADCLTKLLAKSIGYDGRSSNDLTEAERAELKARQNALLPVWQGSRVYAPLPERPIITGVRQISGNRYLVEWFQKEGDGSKPDCYEVFVNGTFVKSTVKTAAYVDLAAGANSVIVYGVNELGRYASNTQSVTVS